MIYVFLANGFEETEAVSTVDILRRAELSVCTVGIGGKSIRGSHGITVEADVLDSDLFPGDDVEAVVLPGGMPGTLNLEKSYIVKAFLEFADANKRLIAAICAAPSILGHKGMLSGRKATCFPGFEEQLYNAEVVIAPVVLDGHILTGRAAGSTALFALKAVEYLAGSDKAEKIRMSMQCME